MLTTNRLIELGFEIRIESNNWYMEKGKFCLFPMNGVWAIGSNLGTLAFGVEGIPLWIDSEEDLRRYLNENQIKILDV